MARASRRDPASAPIALRVAVIALAGGDRLVRIGETATEFAACNTFGPGALVRIAASAGTTYRIAVDGISGATGTYALKVNPPPPNDDFANAANRYVPTYFGWTF